MRTSRIDFQQQRCELLDIPALSRPHLPQHNQCPDCLTEIVNVISDAFRLCIDSLSNFLRMNLNESVKFYCFLSSSPKFQCCLQFGHSSSEHYCSIFVLETASSDCNTRVNQFNASYSNIMSAMPVL